MIGFKKYMKSKRLIPLSKTTFLKVLSLIFFFSLVLSLFYIISYTYENLYLNIYTERDIKKALSWLKGDFHLLGPAMHPKGSVPGPFFYFLLFPPLLLGGNIYSKLLVWRMVWLALSYTTAFYFTRKICKHKESLFIFLMFLAACIGPSLFTPIFFAFNPSFAVMFHILAVMALYTWRESGKNKYLSFLGLIIGFGMQVHGLVSVHILTAFIFFFIQKQKTWKAFFRFIILILLPFLPYLGFYNFYSFEVLQLAIKQLTIFKYALFPSGMWISSFRAITGFTPYLAGPALLLLLSLFYKIGFKKTQLLSSSSINLFIIIVPPVCLLCLIGGNWWYLYSIPVMLMMLFTKLCDDLMPGNPDKKLNDLILLGVLFILPLTINIQDVWAVKFFPGHLFVVGLFLVLVYLIISIKKITRHKLGKISILLIISSLHFSSKDYTRNISHYFSSSQTFPNDTFEDHWMNYYMNSKYYAVKPFLQQIALKTNWSAETAIKRMYIIGAIHRHSSIYVHYYLAKEQPGNIKFSNHSKSQIHGYFVVEHLKQFVNYTQEDWKEYLSESPYVSSFVQEEIKAEKLLLQDSKLYSRYWLIPYRLTKGSVFLEGFHNLGQSYYWEEPHWLKTCSSTGRFTGSNHDFYYCMILPGRLQRAGVYFTFSEETATSFIEVSFFGPLLGLKAESTLLDGYAYWSDITVSLFCNHQEVIHSIPNIGYNPKSWMDLTALSQSLNAPLKLKIPMGCKREDLSKINLRFKHWKRELWDYSEVTPEQKNITWNIL